jgi:imidazolonepropionase-like amidohydrolase
LRLKTKSSYAVGILGFIIAGAFLTSDAMAERKVLVLRNGCAFVGENLAPKENCTIEIRDGRIAQLNPTKIPPDAQVIDATGKFVLPGFVEMHAHLLLHPWDKEGNILPQFDRAASERFLRLLLGHGITTVRDPGAPTEAAIILRKRVADGAIVGPRIFTAGRIINASPFNPEPFHPAQNAAEVRDEIRYQKSVGVDFIKVYGAMPPDLVKVAIEEAHGLGLPVVGHLGATNWKEAADLGIDCVEHPAAWSWDEIAPTAREHTERGMIERVAWLERLEPKSEAVRATARALAGHHVTIDPTLIALHTKFWGDDARYTKRPQLALMPEIFRDGWPKGSFTADWSRADYERAQKVWPKLLAYLKTFHDAGDRLTIGTDTPGPWIIPGDSFHEEMKLLTEAGIPINAILKMATVNGTRALRRAAPEGTIAPGATANLVVLNRNPLEKIENTRTVSAVIRAGEVFAPAALLTK